MTITKTTKRVAVADRPQRRRSGLKATVAPPAVRPGRRAPTSGLSSGAAAGAASAGSQPSNVRVVVRVRPENERERQGNFKTVVRPLDDHMLIFDPRQQDEDFYFQGVRQRGRDLLKRASKDVQYMFDRVFHPHHTNQQLFEATTKDVIDTVIDGFNCSVFAYGSTGAGKTHTMLGAASEPGIIFLTVMELYNRIENLEDKRCEVSVSYVEVYNETVTDLLTPSGPLDVREDGQRAVVISGLSQVRPDGADHLMTILEAGNKNRTQHPTDMNAESSRSHAVFQVLLRQWDTTAALSTDVRLSKLSLIDLAGSERGSATGHKGARFREGANINRSLLALGSCINALADGKKFVPYRDSKLTRLLKDSIGGNCKTVMIAAVTPSSASYEDTHNTLKYADRAKAIKTRLQRNVVSVDAHISQYAKIVDELRREVAELRTQLDGRPPAPAVEAPPPQQEQQEPVHDYAPLREAEATRRQLLTRQLQLEAEAHQLRLRLHRRRLCAQRAAAVRSAGAARPDRLQERLAGRLSQAHGRLEAARAELRAAERRAAEEAGRAPPGPATDQLTAQLDTERHLDECRVHAAHLEAVCRLQQLELAASDQLLGQLVSAVHEQYRVLGYMKFVTPELEAQYKEIVNLLEGQKEVCWADQQSAPADSPGQPSYDVSALLRLTETSYRPADAARSAVDRPRPAAVNMKTDQPETRNSAQEKREDPAGEDNEECRLESVLPPSDTTLGGAATDEALIAAPAPAPAADGDGDGDEGRCASEADRALYGEMAASEALTPRRTLGERAPSPAFFDAEEAPGTPSAAAAAAGGDAAPAAVAGPGQDRPAVGDGPCAASPGAQCDRDLTEVAVSPVSTPPAGAGDSPGAVPARPRPEDSDLAAGPTLPGPGDGRPSRDLNATRTLSAAEWSPAVAGLNTTHTLSAPETSPAPAGLNVTRTLPAPDRGPATNGPSVSRSLPSLHCSPVASDVGRPLPALDHVPVAPDLNATCTLAPPDADSAASDLNATRTLAPPDAGSLSFDLNATRTLVSPADGRASLDPNTTGTLPAAERSAPAAAGPATPPGLPSFERSPIAGPAGLALLPPDLELPPTPEILRRARTPLKTAPPPPPPPAGLDATFTMECFRAPAADGGCAPAGGGGVRAVAGRPTVKAAAAQSKGPERVAPAAVQPPAGRSSVKRPPARVALTAPSSARLSLSATKSKSVSRLPGSGAPAGRDENRPRGESCDRPAWGRASAPSLPGSALDRATGRQFLVSSVGKFGLGRNRAGGMAKSRSTSVLKPFNS